MIVKSLENVKGSNDYVVGEDSGKPTFSFKKGWSGLFFHDTIIHKGTESTFWYKYHVEAVYCMEGEGELKDLFNGKRYSIKAGTMYCLNGHEKHRLQARTDMRMVKYIICSGMKIKQIMINRIL